MVIKLTGSTTKAPYVFAAIPAEREKIATIIINNCRYDIRPVDAHLLPWRQRTIYRGE
jgi:hypothetical protein